MTDKTENRSFPNSSTPESGLRCLTSGRSHFFGFHDLTPWNEKTDELVCLRTDTTEDHVPVHSDVAEVVVINETTGEETVVGTTRAWNWQKGARQRWLPALGPRVVAYNASNETGFECRIADLDAGTTQVLPMPVYDFCPREGFGLSLNFRKLVRCQPGYGYDHPLPETPLPADKDGIFRIDLASGDVRLVLSIEALLRACNMDPSLGEHYFTHIQISPDGRQFVFMHRCFLKSGGLVNQFVVANCDGTEFRVLLDDKMSHFDWSDNSHVLVWCRKNTAIKRLKESKFLLLARALYRLSRKIKINAVRQGIYNEAFREIDVESGKITDVGRGILPEDGHPQLNPVVPHLWVNDTYPDEKGILTLMLYARETNQRVDLIRLPIKAEIKGTDWRCDFHPRWHPAGRRVCFDSSHLGRRQLCIMDVSSQVDDLAKNR